MSDEEYGLRTALKCATAQEQPKALAGGRSPLTAALDAIAAFPTPDEVSQIQAAKARGLMIGYDHRWSSVVWETLSTEEVFQLPIINPETGAQSRTFTQAGKFDGVARFSGQTYLVEHKTTSEDIVEPNATYWKRLAIDAQVSSYALANWQAGRKLDGTLYDVIRKPAIRPKELSKPDRQKIIVAKMYFGYAVPNEVLESIAVGGQSRECAWLYAARLASDCIENPQKYFQRKIIPRLDADLVEFAQELWDVGQSVIEARRHNRHYRNSDACMTYGTPCTFLGICSGHDSPDSERWAKAELVHNELDGLKTANGGRDVLTYSRAKTFQTCRRKHFYRYEMGIKRVDEEDRDALVFGSLVHSALDAWWSSFKESNHVGSGKDAAAGQCPAAGQQTSSNQAVAV